MVSVDAMIDVHLSESTVSSDSDEHRILEHYLMLCARTSRVRIVHAWHITSSRLSELMHQRGIGKQKLLCWIDVNTLEEKENTFQDVLRRGFQVPMKGMTFPFGNIVLPGIPVLALDKLKEMKDIFPVGERRMFRLMLCEIVVGLALPSNKDRSLKTFPEFDSIVSTRFATSPSENQEISWPLPSHRRDFSMHFPKGGPMVGSNASIGLIPPLIIAEQYTIFDSSQVIPRYIVQVESNPCSIERFALPLCDNCDENPAALWCSADKARLCSDCDQHIHEASQLAIRHARRPHSKSKCLSHVTQEPTAFCCICRIPVCRLCAPSHIHRKGYEGSFESDDFLMPIDPPSRAMQYAETFSPSIVESTRKSAAKQLAKVESTRKLVLDDLHEVESKILEILDVALNQLSDQVQHKMSFLVGAQSEAQRKIDEINYSKEFLHYLYAVLPPADYLQFWLRHKRFIKNLEEASEMEITDVSKTLADLQITGGIRIRFD